MNATMTKTTSADTTRGLDVARAALAAVFLGAAWLATGAVVPGSTHGSADRGPVVIPAELAEPPIPVLGR